MLCDFVVSAGVVVPVHVVCALQIVVVHFNNYNAKNSKVKVKVKVC